jgi:hypothetical protein
MREELILNVLVQRLELRHEQAMEVDGPSHVSIMVPVTYGVKYIIPGNPGRSVELASRKMVRPVAGHTVRRGRARRQH